jgi:probable HAF family extracellular repeat protein
MQDLGTPSGGFSTSFAEAFGVNDAGQIVGAGVSFTGLGQAFLWKAGSYTDLGFLPTGNVSSARSINRNGLIAGTSNKQKPNSNVHVDHAATWTTP